MTPGVCIDIGEKGMERERERQSDSMFYMEGMYMESVYMECKSILERERKRERARETEG